MIKAKKYHITIPVDDLNTEYLPYWLGFILADGNIYQAKESCLPIFRLYLQWSDRQHLVKLSNYLQSDYPIGLYLASKKYKTCTLSISSRELVALLNKYQIVARKSLIAKVDERLENNRHFWRGMVDGDGCISHTISRYRDKITHYPYFDLAGTLDVCLSFQKFLKHQIDIHLRPHSVGKIYRISTSGSSVKSILSLLYNNSDIYLDRKYQKYLEIVS